MFLRGGGIPCSRERDKPPQAGVRAASTGKLGGEGCQNYGLSPQLHQNLLMSTHAKLPNPISFDKCPNFNKRGPVDLGNSIWAVIHPP